MTDLERQQETAAAQVCDLFTNALAALTILFRIAPVHAKRITRQLIDEFAKLREQHVGS